MHTLIWTTILYLTVSLKSAGLKELGRPRASFSVPSLLQVRDILSSLEAPIVSTLVQRISLGTDSAAVATIYKGNASLSLLTYIRPREIIADSLHRYDYGKLEYSFTIEEIPPDVTSPSNPFPPGRFHQDAFTGNSNITTLYADTVVPLLTSHPSIPYFFHLDNSTSNVDAALNLDVAILQLLSHRAHIGKIVAEAKYAANATGFEPLIHAQEADALRILLTNTTQETSVLMQADSAAAALAGAWETANGVQMDDFVGSVRNITAQLFRELIDITTEIEIQYLLQRLN